MNAREIEHLWKVANNNPHHDTNWHDPVVLIFAELVISAEREACAKVCDEAAQTARNAQTGPGYDLANIILRHHAVAHMNDAAAIRAR